MHTLELYRVRGSSTWPRYGWRLKSRNGRVVGGDMHQTYSRVGTLKRIVQSIWELYSFDWENGYVSHYSCGRLFRLLDNTKTSSK